MDRCSHIESVVTVSPESNICGECVALGDDWVHLRHCLSCGHVACCDESKNKHATRHFRNSGHPVIRSLDPDDQWTWCYVDESYLDFEYLAPRNPEAEKVVKNYLLIAGLYTLSTSVIWGVNTLFLLEAGLGIMGVFVANAIFTGSMAIFEIPTGVLADTRGRRVSFLLSVFILFLGTLGYVGASIYGGGLLLFGLMSALLGLGYTFYSGAVEAWLVDALDSTGFEGKLDQVFARGSMVTGAAMLAGSIGGGFIGTFDLSSPFVLRAVLLAIVFGVASVVMKDLGFTPQHVGLKGLPHEMSKIASDSIKFGWKKTSVRYLMIASVFQGLFFAWGFYAWQPYFLELLGRDLIWVSGVIAALIALSTIVGNSLVEWFTHYCGKRTTLLLWAAGISTAAAVGVGLAGSFWLAVPLYLIVMMMVGVWSPVRQAYMHQSIPSEQRASVVSFDSLISSGSSMVGQLGLGRVAQVQSIASGYVFGGIATIFVIPVIFALRRLNEKTDVIVGDAGKHGPCAAQGLSSVSAVDANSHVIKSGASG